MHIFRMIQRSILNARSWLRTSCPDLSFPPKMRPNGTHSMRDFDHVDRFPGKLAIVVLPRRVCFCHSSTSFPWGFRKIRAIYPPVFHWELGRSMWFQAGQHGCKTGVPEGMVKIPQRSIVNGDPLFSNGSPRLFGGLYHV